MHFTSLSALIANRMTAFAKGPIALVLAEDAVEVASTLAHLLKAGFARVIVFAPADLTLPPLPADRVDRVDHDILADGALPEIMNAVIPAAAGKWIYYGYNAEYLFYPFCETRSVSELIDFNVEERRETMMTCVIDLYAGDLQADPSAVNLRDAYLDSTGYYAMAREDATGAALDRQVNVFGGLRWRFEEFVPYERRHIERAALFLALPDLRMLPDRTFNLPEHNTYACPWHHNLTAAVCSFRTAKALKRNPGSRDRIESFKWQKSVAFTWQSQQLLDLGMMETGQWF
jgi:hypothetical protein